MIHGGTKKKKNGFNLFSKTIIRIFYFFLAVFRYFCRSSVMTYVRKLFEPHSNVCPTNFRTVLCSNRKSDNNIRVDNFPNNKMAVRLISLTSQMDAKVPYLCFACDPTQKKKKLFPMPSARTLECYR